MTHLSSLLACPSSKRGGRGGGSQGLLIADKADRVLGESADGASY